MIGLVVLVVCVPSRDHTGLPALVPAKCSVPFTPEVVTALMTRLIAPVGALSNKLAGAVVVAPAVGGVKIEVGADGMGGNQ
jgi:hypothetical protein